MKLAALALLPLLAATARAGIAADSLAWAASLVAAPHPAKPAAAAAAAAVKNQMMAAVDDVSVFDSWSYVDCGLASDAIQLKSIKVSPDPPVPGLNLTVEVEADVLETIKEGAYADVTVKLGLIKLLQKQFDVCEEARNANATVQCPVEPGPYSVSQTVELPEEIPKAKFSVQVRGYTDEDEDMLCLDLFVDFMKK